MSHYEIYTFILCLVVFVLLTVLSSFFIATIIKQSIRLTKHGVDDEKIKTEYFKSLKKKKSKMDCIFSFVVCIILAAVFIFSLFVGCSTDTYSSDAPTFRVVNTGSMEKKHKKNEYLVENNLNDQIATFDLIIVYKAPKEEDLKLYDIVVYEVDDIMVVHRIVEIEEPNQYHPNERWFKLQGDAVENPDRFPVKYEQIKGIYKGDRVPFVGSFILFMQSPAGWLCIILVVGAMIITPILEKKLNKVKNQRLIAIGVIKVEESIEQVNATSTEDVEETITDYPVEPEFITEEIEIETENDIEKTFNELLPTISNKLIEYYSIIRSHVERFDGVYSVVDKTIEFRTEKLPIVCMEISGKSLFVHLNADPDCYRKELTIINLSTDGQTEYPLRAIVNSQKDLETVLSVILSIAKKNGLQRKGDGL
ncbi:MAG: hypothetical protein E7375_03155 [Clostridiales bacterium]|nr:hypothetical protein [Clostridiales bacterium]